MARPLTDSQIASYAGIAGFAGSDMDIAVAVAKAESGGNPEAHNNRPPDDSYGLWQINMIGALGPARRKEYHLSSNERLYDPQVNAYVAFGIWKANGWKAWTTYTSGAYKKVMPTDVKSATTDAVKDVTNAVPDAVNAFGKTLFNSVSNLTGVIVAVVLLALGVVILLRSQIVPAKKIAKTVSAVASS